MGLPDRSHALPWPHADAADAADAANGAYAPDATHAAADVHLPRPGCDAPADLPRTGGNTTRTDASDAAHAADDAGTHAAMRAYTGPDEPLPGHAPSRLGI